MDPHNERCTELQYPDLVNFSVSVYVRYASTYPLYGKMHLTDSHASQLHRLRYTRLVYPPALQDHIPPFFPRPQSHVRPARHCVWHGQHRQHPDPA